MIHVKLTVWLYRKIAAGCRMVLWDVQDVLVLLEPFRRSLVRLCSVMKMAVRTVQMAADTGPTHRAAEAVQVPIHTFLVMWRKI